MKAPSQRPSSSGPCSKPVLRAAVLAFSLFLIAAIPPAFAGDLLRPGDTIVGKLRFLQAPASKRDVDRRLSKTSDHPRKFAAEDEFCGSHVFHLVVMNDKSMKCRLDKLLGASAWCWQFLLPGDGVARRRHRPQP